VQFAGKHGKLASSAFDHEGGTIWIADAHRDDALRSLFADARLLRLQVDLSSCG
jgi:hypothetical protein